MKRVIVLLLLAALPFCLGNCSGNYTGPSGSFSSPGFPRNYPLDTICIYHINVHAGKRVLLSFRNFSLEDSNSCRYDRVEIIDGSENKKYCGTALPPSYNSKTNSVTVKFVSDYSQASKGFFLQYRTAATPKPTPPPICNAHLTKANGTISSPGYPAPYKKNLNCTTRITAPVGMRVHVIFTAFDMHARFCKDDYVQIINGASSRRYCGTISPPPITSKTNELTIRFITDSYSYGSNGGYLATYKTVDASFQTGCDDHLTGPNGKIYSLGYPAPYKSNLNCTTTITVPRGKVVMLNFTVFRLEPSGNWGCSYDYLQITDGSSSKKYCEEQMAVGVPFISKTNQLTLWFKTSSSGSYAGYFATYKAVNAPKPHCYTHLTAANGTISSPGYPAPYKKNLNCTTRITAPVGMRVHVIFTAFDMYARFCKDDYVQIINGASSRRYCGTISPPPITSKTNELTIRFITDSYSYGSNGGYLATYKTVDASFQTGCDDNLTGPKGKIYSLGYPAPYKSNLNCTTTITVPRGKVVMLNFTVFRLEPSGNWGCSYDYLQITDGPSSKKYCEEQMAVGVPFISKTNQLTLWFKTSSSGSYAGYFATYKAVNGKDGCNAHLTAPNGTITSPGYPAPYKNNLNCTTRITVAPGKRVHLVFSAFSLETGSGVDNCEYDFVQIIDGSSSSKYCGGSERPPFFLSKTNELTIRFVTDDAATDAGFSAAYKAVDDSYQSGCNDDLTAANGMIFSLGYPARYQNNLNCTTTITVAAGKSVLLNFTKFDLEESSGCSYDYLQITDGTRPKKYCGNGGSELSPFISKTNKLTIEFRTDYSESRGGYFATYKTVDTPVQCNKNLTAPSGSLSSPGFPSPYTNNLKCITRVTVPAGKRLHVTFTTFSLNGKCWNDYLSVVHGSVAMQHCENSIPAPFETSGNQLTLVFSTDASGNGAGYFAIYRTIDTATETSCKDENMTAATGTISSPGYPKKYTDDLDCTSTITVAPGKRIFLNFTAFDVEASYGGCLYDYLQIVDGSRSRKFCGNGAQRLRSYKSKTNKLTLRFKTDSTTTRAGYHATYTAVDAPPPQPPSTVNDLNCGKRSATQSRVIGGVNATKGAWPWQIGIYSQSGGIFCGGSLISPLWVVTAAHCVEDTLPHSIYVQLGDLNLYTDDGTEQKIDVEDIFSHEKYDLQGKINYDIALLKLKRPAMVNNYVNTVCVPSENEPIAVNSTCFITGWGKIKHPGNSHPHLQQASMQVLDSQVCQKRLQETNAGLSMTDKMVCAGVPGTIISGCHGDSGGPFVCRDASTDKFVLHGAVSWGSPRCDALHRYSVFARVQALRGWIDKIMREN